jgi:hypothetical protein
MKNKDNNHCCELMNVFLVDQRVPVNYYPIKREYALILNNSPAVQRLFFCPWCGKTLPKSVRSEYFEILEKEYHIDPSERHEKPDIIPEEFKSDAWWKKRGL